MNPWGNPERFFAITDAAQRRAEVEDLVSEIAQALAIAGEYRTRIDLQPTQRVVDFNWAAHQAGRRVGIRVDVDVTISKSDATAEIRVLRRHALS